MSTEPKMTEQEWIYIGRRAGGANNEVYDCFVPLTSDGWASSGIHSYATKRNKSRKTIGAVYKVQATPDGNKAQIKLALYDRMYNVKGAERVILQWRAEHDAFELRDSAQRMQKEMKDESLKPLEPLRALYRASGPVNKMAIELLVLSYIRE